MFLRPVSFIPEISGDLTTAFRRFFLISLFLTGFLLAAGCSTTPLAPAAPGEIVSITASPVHPVAAGSPAPLLVPTRNPMENEGLFVSICPVPDHAPGDIITFSGITNLPAGENITTRVFEARYKCTKCQWKKNDSVDGCCGNQIPLDIPVLSGTGGVNTWSREVNTSRYDFTPGDYSIDAGEPSRGIWNSSGFTVREKPEPSRPRISIDPVSHHYLGDTIAFRGITNLAPGEMIRILIYEGVYHSCPKSLDTCHDSVQHCCDGHGTIIPVITGNCGINTWSWDVDTSQYGFGPDGEYIISAIGRNGSVENTSFFIVSGLPKPNLTLNLPANDSGGSALRFSGHANTGNGPDKKLLLTVSSDSGKMASFIVPVYANGTGYFWNYTVNKSAIVPYNFLTVNVRSQSSPTVSIERTFMYTNEPAYYPYNPVGP